jgi:glycerophosphoryl diester phosphodiesterase
MGVREVVAKRILFTFIWVWAVTLQSPTLFAFQDSQIPTTRPAVVTQPSESKTARFEQIKAAFEDPDSKTVLVAAHRGGRMNDKADNATENSVANVAVAVRKGYEVYETDIRLTKDGTFVIVHDATLDRETDGTGPVEEMMMESVRKLKKRFRDGSMSDQPVATLEELLTAGKDKVFFKADLKPGVVEHFDRLARLITKMEVQDQVILRTEYKHLWKLQKCFGDGTPKVHVMFKVNDVAQVEKVDSIIAPKTIQINFNKDEVLSNEKKSAIARAIELGMLVESHVYGDDKQSESLVVAGVRMFHTSDPDDTMRFLKRFSARARSGR